VPSCDYQPTCSYSSGRARGTLALRTQHAVLTHPAACHCRTRTSHRCRRMTWTEPSGFQYPSCGGSKVSCGLLPGCSEAAVLYHAVLPGSQVWCAAPCCGPLGPAQHGGSCQAGHLSGIALGSTVSTSRRFCVPPLPAPAPVYACPHPLPAPTPATAFCSDLVVYCDRVAERAVKLYSITH